MEGRANDSDPFHQRIRIACVGDEPPAHPPREPVSELDLPESAEWEWCWWGRWWVWIRARWELWAWYGEERGWHRLSRHEDDDPNSGYAFLFGPGVPEVVAVASLAGFLGGFAASFSQGFAAALGKEVGQATGAAAAKAASAAAGRLRDHLRAVRDKSRATTIELQDGHQVLLVTGAEVDQLPDVAFSQLLDLDFPPGPGRLRWDPYAKRWRVLNGPQV